MWKNKLISAGLGLSLIMLVGRIAGLLRDIQLGAAFGLSPQGDIAVILLTTPDLIVNILLSGGIGAALIPEFVRLPIAERSALFFRVKVAVFVVFAAIGAMIAARPDVLLFVLAPGYLNTSVPLYHEATMLLGASVPFAALAGVTAALMNASQRFLLVGAGTTIFNLTVIAVMLAFSTSPSLWVLGWGIFLACLLRYLSQALVTPAYLSWNWALPDYDYKELAGRLFSTILASALVAALPIITRTLLSIAGEGNIAAFNFATKLVDLPAALIFTAIATISFTVLSRHVAENDVEQSRAAFLQYIRLSLLLSVCVALPGIWFAYPVSQLLFQYGSMTQDEVAHIASLAQVALLSLPGIAGATMATAMLNANKLPKHLLSMTILAALSVPLLAAPGLISSDARLLIAALPLAQTLLAVLLLRGIPNLGGIHVVLDKRLAGTLALVVVAFAIFAIADRLLSNDAIVVRLALASGSGIVSLLVVFLRSREAS